MKPGLAPKLASAGTAVAGIAAAAAACVLVGGLPGLLYAAGIALAALVGAVAISASRTRPAPEPKSGAAPSAPRWKRKKQVMAELQLELDARTVDLEEHRQALANLAAQREHEADEAAETERRLEARIATLEDEQRALQALLAEERAVFDETLEALGGGIGRHGSEIAQLERELEALIAR